MPKLILNIEKIYRNHTTPFEIEKNIDSWIKDGTQTERLYLPYDIEEFLKCSRHKFDRVAIYRYLEHVSFVQVLYFIYLISTITMKDSFVDVIVPDYKKLAKMIFRSGKTLGIRANPTNRIKLARQERVIDIKGAKINVKIAKLDTQSIIFSEYDDMAKAMAKLNMSYDEIYCEILRSVGKE